METNTKPSNPDYFRDKKSLLEDRTTLRDCFANSAMQTLLNQKHYDGQQMYELNESRFISYGFDSDVSEKQKEDAKQDVLKDAETIARRSYLMADAMLKIRNETE